MAEDKEVLEPRPTFLKFILARTFAESDARRAEEDARRIVRHWLVCKQPKASGEYNLCSKHALEQKRLQDTLL